MARMAAGPLGRRLPAALWTAYDRKRFLPCRVRLAAGRGRRRVHRGPAVRHP
ncbi:hypothetical protein GCM10010389_43980 [Streptomyces echinoruber]|uniref:Uncharacterized protein n=1 Tax=Streptomyces echinoruber TaxID=68898 RepID=A0A918VIF9_9ACTN|nr:hypothetical protein GCM10010389_43980 [Streptomyces echinoruber]